MGNSHRYLLAGMKYSCWSRSLMNQPIQIVLMRLLFYSNQLSCQSWNKLLRSWDAISLTSRILIHKKLHFVQLRSVWKMFASKNIWKIENFLNITNLILYRNSKRKQQHPPLHDYSHQLTSIEFILPIFSHWTLNANWIETNKLMYFHTKECSASRARSFDRSCLSLLEQVWKVCCFWSLCEPFQLLRLMFGLWQCTSYNICHQTSCKKLCVRCFISKNLKTC